MTVGVIDTLEIIDISQKYTEWRSVFFKNMKNVSDMMSVSELRECVVVCEEVEFIVFSAQIVKLSSYT